MRNRSHPKRIASPRRRAYTRTQPHPSPTRLHEGTHQRKVHSQLINQVGLKSFLSPIHRERRETHLLTHALGHTLAHAQRGLECQTRRDSASTQTQTVYSIKINSPSASAVPVVSLVADPYSLTCETTFLKPQRSAWCSYVLLTSGSKCRIYNYDQPSFHTCVFQVMMQKSYIKL